MDGHRLSAAPVLLPVTWLFLTKISFRINGTQLARMPELLGPMAASVGFMLPVATPPNAIVFSYGTITSRRMLHAGAPLDLIGVAVAVLAGMVFGPLVI